MADDDDGTFQQPLGDVPLFDLIEDISAYPTANLLELSGDATVSQPAFRSGLTMRVAEAWGVPLPDLTCGQVRVLVGQKLGLRWLSAPVAVFLRETPDALCDLYPGDLMWVALRAHEEFVRFAPVETRAMLAGDFGWMDEAFAQYPDAMLRETRDNLASARHASGLP